MIAITMTDGQSVGRAENYDLPTLGRLHRRGRIRHWLRPAQPVAGDAGVPDAADHACFGCSATQESACNRLGVWLWTNVSRTVLVGPRLYLSG